MRAVLTKFAPILALPFLLSACSGDAERALGLTRDAPDEFTVTTRAPLSLPPDFEVQPPRPGAARPQELTPQQAAEASIAPGTALAGSTNGPQTPGQQALVASAGPTAPANIRDQVNSETSLDHAPESLADRLMFWKSAPTPGTMVDPTAEAQRLRENAALGQPLNSGTTPIIVDPDKKKDTGWFSGIF